MQDDPIPQASDVECPVFATARIVTGKWTLLILRDLVHKPCRFSELERSLTGISTRTLAQRLKALEEEGLIEREVYAEAPPRVEYRLTPKGRDVVPIVDAMRCYGERWLSADREPQEDAAGLRVAVG